MIELKNCATYHDTGASIENCQKINFFYGPNGSGKSTIGNFLKNPSDSQYTDCRIDWGNGPQVDVIVYNRDFREKNFQGDIAGVFTLGQATIDDIKALEEMKKQREQKNDEFIKRNETLEKKKKEENDCKEKFKDTVWNKIFKPNDAEFQEAFTGMRNNKERFRDEVIKHFKKSHSSSESRENLFVRARTLFVQKPESCANIPWNLDCTIAQIAEIETSFIWNKVIVGNKDLPIGKLIENLNNADWVNQGRKHIADNEICPFCQQPTINQELKNQLDRFFCGEYEQDVNLVTNLIAKYKSCTDELLQYVNSLQSTSETYPAAQIKKEKLGTIIELLKGCFSKNQAEMLVKQKEPGRNVSLSKSSETINSLHELITLGNAAIAMHNKMVDNYASERTTLISDIWEFLMAENQQMISDYLSEIANIDKAQKGIKAGLDICKQQLKELDEKIIEDGKNITSVQPTVDEINRSLKSYDFTNFQIVPAPYQANAYQIQRMDGSLANNTLSEGEETFISFLYFLQFAKGDVDISKVSKRKILVLDDPICSLDSTVLYIVSSLVKKLIKDVRNGKSDVEQLFILTHNVFFHKEASFVDGRTKEVNDVNYWIISKDNNISTIRAFNKTNPIKSSYELLWQELKTNNSASLVTTQNIMRRILENYFRILGTAHDLDDRIINTFESPEEKMICHSLLCWINDGSHSIPDDLHIDSYTDSIERYRNIFKEIFYRMNHAAHYEMMMQ